MEVRMTKPRKLTPSAVRDELTRLGKVITEAEATKRKAKASINQIKGLRCPHKNHKPDENGLIFCSDCGSYYNPVKNEWIPEAPDCDEDLYK